MPFVRVKDGSRIFCHATGDGKIALVFLHGMGSSSAIWNNLLKCVALEPFKRIVLDFRGHGKSSCPVNRYTWEIFSDDVIAVMEHFHIETFVPVGFSLGGKMACYITSKYRKRIPAQILIAPAAPGIVSVDAELGLPPDFTGATKTFRTWFGKDVEPAAVEFCYQQMLQTPKPVLEATAKMALQTSLEPEIGLLNLPTLVVTGDTDPICHAGYQRKSLLPFVTNALTRDLDCGHVIPLERPQALADLISDFIFRRSANS